VITDRDRRKNQVEKKVMGADVSLEEKIPKINTRLSVMSIIMEKKWMAYASFKISTISE